MNAVDRKRVAGSILTILSQHLRGDLDFSAAVKASVHIFVIFS